MLETIEALCRVIEELLSTVKGEATRLEIEKNYKAVMGETCVCCGAEVPEGQQVCPRYEMKILKKDGKENE